MCDGWRIKLKLYKLNSNNFDFKLACDQAAHPGIVFIQSVDQSQSVGSDESDRLPRGRPY